MSHDLDSVLLLIDELRSEDHNTRLHAINNLEHIATAIGPERSREELVPYMSELLEDDNEEVLLALASKLGELKNYVGPDECKASLLIPLQTLAGNEEDVVRNKAIESLNAISSELPTYIIIENLVPIIKTLAASEWFSARIAACYLFSIPLRILDAQSQHELIMLYCDLAKDDTPMVRRAAALNIGQILNSISEQAYKDQIMSLFDSLTVDEHDSVRQMTLESIVQILSNQPNLISVAMRYAKDRSWRVRYALTEFIGEISDLVEENTYLSNFVELLKDPEAEVRSIAVSKLIVIIHKMKESSILNFLLPALEPLVKDASPYVKISLIQTLCQLPPKLGPENSVMRLLPLINKLIKDENYEVRMTFAENIHSFNSTIGADKVLIFTVPLLLNMMNDPQWRVRLKVIEYIPQLSELIDKDKFNEKITEHLMRWVEDPVYTIRDTTLDAIVKLATVYGNVWATQTLTPMIKSMSSSDNFTKRMTALLAVKKLFHILNPKEAISVLLKLSNDNVPNIRFNVAKIIQYNTSHLQFKQEFMQIIEKLSSDTDRDVQHYANQVYKTLNT